MYDKWQRKWDETGNENKLKQIKKEVREWNSSNNEERRIEVTMTRLRIGHTHITHSHLMTLPHGPNPVCEHCGAHQSVKHMIKECPRRRTLIERYFGNKELRQILGEEPNSSVKRVIAYLKEAELLNKI